MEQLCLSEDLIRLRNEGVVFSLAGGRHLSVDGVPYLNQQKVLKSGTLVMKLATSGTTIRPPEDHTAYWIGEQPAEADGSLIKGLVNSPSSEPLDNGRRASFFLSCKQIGPDGRYIPDRSDYQKLYYMHSYNITVMMCGAGLLKTWDGRTETFANVCQEFEREHDGGIKLDYPIVTDELIECFRQKSMINPQVDVNLIISGFTSAMPIITLVSIRNGDIRYRDYTLIQGNVCHAGDIPPKEESEHPAWKIMDGCFADRPQLNNPVMYWTSAVQHAIVSLTQIQADWSSTIGGHPTVVALHAGRQNPEVVMKPEWLVL